VRLIRNFLGSEFGNPSFGAKLHLHRNFDLERADALVDRALNLAEGEKPDLLDVVGAIDLSSSLQTADPCPPSRPTN
jgi:hypothetical protein